MKKPNIRVFGEISIAHVEKRGLFSYAVVRDFDKKVLAKSFSFRILSGNPRQFNYRDESVLSDILLQIIRIYDILCV